MRKVVVLGCNGMAGHIMVEYLDAVNNYQVIGIARNPGDFVSEQIDVLDFSKLQKLLERVKPDIVVNCIGVLIDKAENDVRVAIQINSYLPNLLSKLGKQIGFKLVHISTDCVFSGKDGQYTEKSFRDGDDYYARTKALGEVDNEKDLTIRTSIIGPELKTNGTGLLDWFFKQNGKINGYTKAIWSGVTTLELAKATCEFIKQDITGIFHLCPDENISKYELLRLFSKIWDKNIEIIPSDQYQIDKSLVCTRADFDYRIPGYSQMLTDLKAWMSDRPNYYLHYTL